MTPADPKQQSVIEWLLEPSTPVIRYRTLTELLGECRSSKKAREAKAMIAHSADVLHVFSHLGPDGLFPHIPKYFASATTAYHLQSGLARDPRVAEWVSTVEGNILARRARPCRNYTAAFQCNPRRPVTCLKASCKALLLHHDWNLQVWLDCRETAVEFLAEARSRLPGKADEALESAMRHYRAVAAALREASGLVPKKQTTWEERLKFASPEAAQLIRAAGDAERQALDCLERIVAAV